AGADDAALRSDPFQDFDGTIEISTHLDGPAFVVAVSLVDQHKCLTLFGMHGALRNDKDIGGAGLNGDFDEHLRLHLSLPFRNDSPNFNFLCLWVDRGADIGYLSIEALTRAAWQGNRNDLS